MLLATAVALPLAGALPANAGQRPDADVPVAAGDGIVPVFRDGVAQPVFDPADALRESLHVRAPVDSDRDGVDDEMYVEVVRPAGTADGLQVPVVYFVSPYFSGGNPMEFHDVDVELYVPDADGAESAGVAPRTGGAARTAATTPRIRSAYEDFLLARGYGVVYAESLGTGQSTGCPTSGGENETVGARAVVDWLNGRAEGVDAGGNAVTADWATGSVGMMGVSYNGTLPNAVAATGVEGLDAIVPIAAISNWYDYYRADGAVVAPGGYQGEDLDSLAEYVYTRSDREICREVIAELTERQDRVTGDYSDFWDERNYVNNAHQVEAAVLAVHGLNDWNVKTRHVAQWYEALARHDVPRQIWLHQSGHVDPLGLRREEWLDALNRWFTNYLHKVPNGVADQPRAVLQREDGSWVEEADWPAPGTEPVELHPWPGGSAVGTLTARGAVPGGPTVERLVDDATRPAAELVDAPRSGNRLSYTSAPVREPMRLSGTPRVELRAAFARPAANLTVVLVDRAPDGTNRAITRGWVDPQNREDIASTLPITPGEFYRVDVQLQAHDHVLPTGHSLGLVVLSSDRDYTLRPAPGAGIAVDLADTRLVLPVVGGADAVAAALPR